MQQQQCQVAIPDGVEPGGMFIANTPDGQQVQITAPPGSGPGQLVTFNYMPIGAPPATVVGQPLGQAGGGGYGGGYGGGGGFNDEYNMDAPPMWSMETREEAQRRQDKISSEVGWVMYFVGWALCCCCGPIGPVFWLGVACVHWAKPKEQRDALRQERTVAVTSLATSIFCIFVTMILVVMVMLSDSDKSEAGQGEGGQATEPVEGSDGLQRRLRLLRGLL